MTALCVGDGNIDGGGGNLNGSVEGYYWSGADAVRVTIIKDSSNTAASVPIDFTNSKPNDIQMHFGKVSKLQYRNGSALYPSSQKYKYNNPQQALPRIVSTSGTVNITAIKNYFTDEQIIKSISTLTEFSYTKLIGGEYKLLLEPVAYFTVGGIMSAMTAHEAALYDQQTSGLLRRYMPSLTHKNLPLSLFLETSDLGFPAWNGNTTEKVSSSQILTSLGVGIVRFGQPDSPVELEVTDYEYRVDTDVVSAITVTAGKRVTPDSSAMVMFNIGGRYYTVENIVIPEGESQVVWVKWHTPLMSQKISISATVSGNGVTFSDGYSQKTFIAKIIDLKEKAPPNPTANDEKPMGYSITSVPSKINKTSANWGVWSCYWKSDWQWQADWQWQPNMQWKPNKKYDVITKTWIDMGKWVDKGQWIDQGKWADKGDWEYKWTDYQANLWASMQVSPDTKVPTAAGKVMKSGYGVNLNVKTTLSSNAPASAITGAQNVLSYFPEFNYTKYIRVSDMTTGGYNAEFALKVNEYSTYGRRVHFTPLWFPDGRYEPMATVIDVWTPAGMLTCNLSDYVNIRGNVYDDWHVAPNR